MLRSSNEVHANCAHACPVKILNGSKCLVACVVTLFDTRCFYAAACEMLMKCGAEMFHVVTQQCWRGR